MPSIDVHKAYDLGTDFEPAVLAAILGQPGFYDRFRPVISEDLFRDRTIRVAVGFVERHHDKYKRVPDRAILIDAVRNSQSPEAGAIVSLLEEGGLPEITDPAYIADRIINWCKWSAIESVLSDDHARQDPREFSKLVQSAASTGDSLLLEHTKLDEDGDGEMLRGDIIPSPWAWLNERLDGGPERGDLVAIMTVINGGKTTILTNVARYNAGAGYHVVYFTFEDGEKKIKRRVMQCINGWTTEEIIVDLERARKRRDMFLSNNGGKLHIKQLRTRRDTVDDAMAYVRAVEESEGRKVDVVITDYPDLFRCMTRYNEPRHALREIWEDCKYLARSLNVQHWVASQINTRLGAGKEVVGIEFGSEATGKFESCDIALGFGQSLEDNRLGRITMHTSKMRDGPKNETLPMMVDFEVQRVYQVDDQSMRRERKKR